MANAKQSVAYAPRIRQKWYFLVDKADKTADEVCDLYFISRKTCCKWRSIDCGNRAPVPKEEHPDTKLKGNVKEFACMEKIQINYGPKKMKLLLKRRFNLDVSTTSIYELYQKKELIRRPQNKNPVIPEKPEDVVQVDAKYVRQDNQRKYPRTFIDIFTGFQHAVIVENLIPFQLSKLLKKRRKCFPLRYSGYKAITDLKIAGGSISILGSVVLHTTSSQSLHRLGTGRWRELME